VSADALFMKFQIRVFAVLVILLYLNKRYNPAPTISRVTEMKKIIQLIYLMGIIYIFFKILTKTTSIDKAQYELVFLHLFLVLDLSLRLFIRSIQKLFLLRGIGGRATIIIGWETDAIHVASEISRKPTLGYKLKGYIADKESRKMSHYTPYLGKITGLRIPGEKNEKSAR